MDAISQDDPALYSLLVEEEIRQRETLNLIASENFAPKSILQAGASLLTNKYTEGYPGKRYYGGCSVFDEIEILARDRAKELFSAEWANVQPHSGASANNAVFMALLRPGDKILGLALDHGGHLTHGMKINVSGHFYESSFYHLDNNYTIDMNEVEERAKKEKPKMIIAGWSAYSDFIDFAAFRQIADDVEALLLVDMSHFSGLVAGGVYPNPVPWADVVTSTTHKTLRGPRGGFILSRSNDYSSKIDRAVFPGQQGGALGHVVAAKALAFHLAGGDDWTKYAQRMVSNAAALADSLEERGRKIISQRRTHQLLLDLQGQSGREAEEILEGKGIVVNRNTIPFETRGAADPSGLRLGSPALTTRGFREGEFQVVGSLIDRALRGEDVSADVANLTKAFPLD